MAEPRHCAACSAPAEAYEVDLGDGLKEVRCLRCGLPLERLPGRGPARLRRVLVADDAAFFTRGLAEHLRSSGTAQEVVAASDGAEAVERVTRALHERDPYQLVILDFLMPRLNGLHAAIAVRAVERGLGARPSDLLFLSSRQLDGALQPLLEDLAPAYYLNKGGGTGTLLGPRLDEVIGAIVGAARRRPGR